MIKLLSKFKIFTITLLSISSVGMSSASFAHSSPSTLVANNSSKIEVIAIARVQNTLLPPALYTRTLGHTFTRKFAVQGEVIKQVYYRKSQSTARLYAVVEPKSASDKLASSYWP